MTHANFYTTCSGWLVKRLRLCMLSGLLLARAASGTDALYENDGIVDYTGGVGTYPPAIDATNFVNTGSFTIDWAFIIDTTASLDNYLYETWNTVNYTNSSLMSSDIGFVFDTQTGNVIPRQMAGSFYNPGEVDCGYQFLAWATNIVNPGSVNVPGYLIYVNPGTLATGVGALLQFTGQNVDLSRSALTIAGGQGTAQAIGLLGMIGKDTNSDWDATFDLGPTYAFPSFPVSGLLPPSFGGYGFPNLPLNTTSYFNIQGVGTNTIIYRAVFLQDASPNVSHNVYFDTGGGGVGGGNATIEWVGSYVDPATGNPATHYLYLNDNYLQSVATNDPSINGIPENFTFTENLAQIFLGTPTAAGFFNVFDSGFVSNRFAYVSAQLIATSSGTNSIPNHAITNLPARIQINASRELNLAQAQITQPDYLSLRATNQYDGNAGALIAAPYSDLNLGVTNGYLTITNLLPQAFPIWSGTVQAWSTRWFILVTNTVDGTNFFAVTNDFRVEIVASQLAPTTLAQVQDFILHGTNIVISDAFNVMRTLSIDARSLTLTTNVYGNGASSADGELNLESAGILWPSSLPNLRWLTNNGTISTMNLADFGSSAQPYSAFVNRGRVSNLGGSAIWAQDFENYGTFYSGSGGFSVQSLAATMTNGSVVAGGSITIGTGSLVISNSVLSAGAALNLTATNLLTDNGVTNGNNWNIGSQAPSASPGIYFNNGFNLPVKPAAGDLLATTVFSVAPPQVVLGGITNSSVTINNLWAALDHGVSNTGYTNNAAVGLLILDAQGKNSVFKFNGTGASNAIYVDRLDLRDYASYTNHNGGGNLPALVINSNLVIYYADAVAAGAGFAGSPADVSVQINHKNNDHLRWVPTYAGYFSSTNLAYFGTTNAFNVALAENAFIDSDGDGVANASDPTPFFLPGMVNLTVYPTNNPANTMVISWQTIPLATNTVFYTTNLMSPITWTVLTNFISPQPRPNPATNVMVFDPMVVPPRYYQVMVYPWLTWPY